MSAWEQLVELFGQAMVWALRIYFLALLPVYFLCFVVEDVNSQLPEPSAMLFCPNMPNPSGISSQTCQFLS